LISAPARRPSSSLFPLVKAAKAVLDDRVPPSFAASGRQDLNLRPLDLPTVSRCAPGDRPVLVNEAVELTRRLKLPHIRRHLLELVPTARAQRWDHAELVRVLLAEEAAGRDATNLRTRRARAGFPAGKTLHDWDAAASTIPRPTQDALTSLGPFPIL
jgi:hypothetical protein